MIETAGNALWVSPLTFLEASTPGTGGFIDTANQRLGIQHISPITTPESLGRVTLEGTKMQLGDVATVVEDHPPLIGDALTAEGPGLMFVIEKAPGASTLDVTRKTEDAIKEMQPGLAGVTVRHDRLPARDVHRARHQQPREDADRRPPSSRSWRSRHSCCAGAPVAIILITVPLSFVAAALVLDLTGATMNAVAFVGLLAALALVIDDAIVTVGLDLAAMREDGAESTASAIVRASLDVRSASVYATLVVAWRSCRSSSSSRCRARSSRTPPSSYLLALLAALVVSITVTPALAVLLLSRKSVAGASLRSSRCCGAATASRFRA